jgi:ubiquinone/menaquinone biosynthesis C-methylase UbiE
MTGDFRERQDQQREHWESKHIDTADEFSEIAGLPNGFAQECATYLSDHSKVLELGTALGRDARYFAREKGSEVFALDFSHPVLKVLKRHAQKDGVEDKVFPVQADIKQLPLAGKDILDAAYARSSLHISDEQLDTLLKQLLEMLKDGGYLMIEGKTPEDSKIKQSEAIENNLVIDDEGHLRRVWDEDYIRRNIIEKFGLDLISLSKHAETIKGQSTEFINFIAQKHGN